MSTISLYQANTPPIRQQIARQAASVRSAAASSVATPEPTPTRPTRRFTRSFAAWERAQELEHQNIQNVQPQHPPRPARLHFDDSFVPDMVTDPNATSPVHGTKRMRSFEEMMSETHTPEKDKMARDIDKLEQTTKRADRADTARSEPAFRAPKRARLPIRNSPRLSGSNTKNTSRGGAANDNSMSSSQEGGSQESQPSQRSSAKS